MKLKIEKRTILRVLLEIGAVLATLAVWYLMLGLTGIITNDSNMIYWIPIILATTFYATVYFTIVKIFHDS